MSDGEIIGIGSNSLFDHLPINLAAVILNEYMHNKYP